MLSKAKGVTSLIDMESHPAGQVKKASCPYCKNEKRFVRFASVFLLDYLDITLLLTEKGANLLDVQFEDPRLETC